MTGAVALGDRAGHCRGRAEPGHAKPAHGPDAQLAPTAQGSPPAHAAAPHPDRRAPPPPPAETPPPADVPEPETRGPEFLRSGEPAEAKVISVVDERTIGPVTRSRLTLEVPRNDGSSVEVTTRVAFPTPAARARVKVGGTIPVRYDRDDPTRLVVDLPAD